MRREEIDLTTMKLLHYFITEKNYNPVIVHGIQNEIWLENMNNEPKIVRIVTKYIHNKEQLEFDSFKLKRLVSQIKFKTLSLSMKTLTIYLDLNEDIKLVNTKKDYYIDYKNEKLFLKDKTLLSIFPDIKDKLIFSEEGALLYEKINNDILRKNLKDTEQINELFKKNKPFITTFLISVMVLIFFLMYVLGNGSEDIKTLYYFGALVKDGTIIRTITSIFLHIGLIHLIMNMWALKIIGEQIENFYGHLKMFIIFIFSGIIGNLLSLLLMNNNAISAGASGAIFGLMGALLYFSLVQRTYMNEALKKNILPVIIVNLLLGFMISGINMYAHLGGLIGGVLISMALGVKYKSTKSEKINGLICSMVLLGSLLFLIYR